MERTLSSEAKAKVGEKVLVKGWLHNVRDIGKILFLVIRDRGGFLQIVVDNKDEINKLKHLQSGSILYIEGEVKATDATEQGVEIIDPKISVEVEVKDVPPVNYYKKSLDVNVDTELDYRPLVIRNPKKAAIFKVQAGILKAFADSMRSQGFTEFRSPVLMGVPSESGASVFEVGYFEGKAYLAQSPQIYKQIMVGAFERVFTIATVFRAEKHNTSRHLMEITQMDGEMGFIESYDEVLDVIEKVIRDIFDYLKNNHSEELKLWEIELPKLPDGKFPKIKVKEALRKIEELTGKSAKREELDLDPEDERTIGKWALEEYGSDFLWLLNFKKNKNFYTWNNKEDEEESLSYDLECKGLEWLSGTHRIHDYEILLERLKEQGLSEEFYEQYLMAFKYGIPSEAGFSFGLERMTKQIFNLDNIREATLFPSDLNRVAAAKRHIETVKNGSKELISMIKKVLDSRAIEYKFVEHEAVKTSEEAARVRGTNLEDGAKAMVLVGKKTKKNIMVVIPAHKKLDTKAVAEKIGEPVEFEKPENILQKFGIEVGGVPPFGKLLGMEVLLDEEITKTEMSAFNSGERTSSFIMKSEDLKEVLEAGEGNFSV